MITEQIEQERREFEATFPAMPQTKQQVFGEPQWMFSHTRVAENAWMKRAAIAHAEKAELVVEIERLKAENERLKDGALPYVLAGQLVMDLYDWHNTGREQPFDEWRQTHCAKPWVVGGESEVAG